MTKPRAPDLPLPPLAWSLRALADHGCGPGAGADGPAPRRRSAAARAAVPSATAASHSSVPAGAANAASSFGLSSSLISYPALRVHNPKYRFVRGSRRNACNALCNRDFTVPVGMPKASSNLFEAQVIHKTQQQHVPLFCRQRRHHRAQLLFASGLRFGWRRHFRQLVFRVRRPITLRLAQCRQRKVTYHGI